MICSLTVQQIKTLYKANKFQKIRELKTNNCKLFMKITTKLTLINQLKNKKILINLEIKMTKN